MGTNYYWRYNLCACCGRYDEQHVGKSSAGFEAVFDEDPQTCVSVPRIVSWADWKRVFRGELTVLRDVADGRGELWNEYDEMLDVEEFIASKEAVAPELRRRQYDWTRDNQYRSPIGLNLDEVSPDGEWLDDDGWTFSGRGFS